MKEKKWRKMICCTAMLLFSWMFGTAGWAMDIVPQETSATPEIEEDTVLVGGMPVGIYMETDGVLVVDTQEVKGMDGRQYEPAAHLIKAGDYITGCNETEIPDKETLITSLNRLEEDEVVLHIRRNTSEFAVKINAVECEPGEYKLGLWVRDDVQGLGTVTFMNQDGEFGALGHGIHDGDTSVLLNIAEGRVYQTSIRSVIKGENGMPGSMEGLIVYNRYNRLGTITQNTDLGIYGTIEKPERIFEENIAVQTASKEEVKTGPATIRCYVNGEVREYQIRIQETYPSAEKLNKGMVIQVTDEELLRETGGIVQGMSGSPILQNGKLVGAVTHVFVSDPTKGYGIYADTMIKEIEGS